MLDPSGQVLLDTCVDDLVAAACSRIQRSPNGSLALIDSRHANGASLLASGYDLDLSYGWSMRGGDFTLRVNTSYLERYDYVPVEGATTIGAAGSDFPLGALPRWRSLGYVEYAYDDWIVSYQAQFIGSMSECGEAFRDAWGGCRTIDDRWYHDLRLQYHFAAGPAVTFAIDNVTDVDPPRVNFSPFGSANTDTAAYPVLGRTYYVQLSYRIE